MSRMLALRLWPAHLLAVAAVAAAVLLGLWQFGAANAEREAAARDLSGLAPVPLSDVLGPDDPFPGEAVGRPVELSGTWVPESTVLVSGREHDGQDGYWVLTPLAIGDVDAPALPVVRGWIADVDEAPAPPQGTANLVARLQPAEGTGVMDTDRGDDVLPQVRMADLVQHVEQDLYGAYAVADAEADPAARWHAGLQPASIEQLPEVDTFTGLRSYLYGIEWFVFALFAAYIWWRHVREALAGPAASDDLPTETDPEPETVASPS